MIINLKKKIIGFFKIMKKNVSFLLLKKKKSTHFNKKIS